jgi:hypothetical protein
MLKSTSNSSRNEALVLYKNGQDALQVVAAGITSIGGTK